MRDICNKVVPQRFAGGVGSGVGLDVRGHIEGTDGECDNGGVAFMDEFVFGEAFDMEDYVGGKGVKEAIAFALAEEFLGFYAVIFGEDGCKGYLGLD
jgi:hypothetical protein